MKVFSVHEALAATQKKLRDTEAERDALAASNRLLNALIASMQNAAIEYLQPDGGADEFINRVIYLLDGPEQRAAQAAPQQCLRDVQAGAVEKFFAHFESASFWDKTVNDVIDEGYEYAATVRQGGAE